MNTAIMENRLVPQKQKQKQKKNPRNRATFDPAIPLLGIYAKELK
jgi:hypothetical protein